MFIQSGINKEKGFMAVTVETLDLSFEYADGSFCNFKDANGKSYAKTYKTAKRKIGKQFGIDMSNGSSKACDFMKALKEAKSGMAWAT